MPIQAFIRTKVPKSHWQSYNLTAMTRSSQQTYIQKLGFQDKDKSNPRHGLACEYLAERLIQSAFLDPLTEKEMFPDAFRNFITECKDKDVAVSKKEIFKDAVRLALPNFYKDAKEMLPTSRFTDTPIKSKSYGGSVFINGFTDVLVKGTLYAQSSFDILDDNIKAHLCPVFYDGDSYGQARVNVMGEIKITPEPAESILQQIKFYREFVKIDRVVVLVDFDAPQLKRITQGSDIEVYKLGKSFEEWVQSREQLDVEEF